MAFRIQLLLTYTALCLLSLYHAKPMSAVNLPEQKVKLTAFSWTDCGPASYPNHVKSLAVTPDPVHIPGNITVDVSFVVGTTSPTDVSMAITLEKKIAGFWIKIPCVDNLGSCTYNDACGSWAKICPTYFAKYGLPCACPIAANTYSVPDAELDVTTKLPPGTAGDLRITANLVSQSAGTIFCLQLLVTVATD